ncbi:RHS repeat domain-containing protein [Pseudomonas sp. RB5]|uniref:RHS repeat domain-containing protein n=1 Tax=Pseudomonas retamae TaxID=702110 RepID=A0ABW7DHL5_9PSED
MERLVTQQSYNAIGEVIEKRDARLSSPDCRPNVTTLYSLAGKPLKSISVDAGWRLNLPGLAGEPLQRWDERGSRWHSTFDEQLRVVALAENNKVVDTFIYADATADGGHNLRGQLVEQHDCSGTLQVDSYSLAAQPLSETRTFNDGEAFASQWRFSPLGMLLEQTDAGGHRQRSHYSLAGQLKQTHLHIGGVGDWQAVLLDMRYNAANQIIEQLAGNDVRSRWTYDPADGRLHTQSSRISNGDVLQDFKYFYDRVGNITRIEDHNFETRHFANQLIDGHRDFSYDSLYRLISATGYDDAPPADIPGLPQPGDPNNRLNYTQTYQYDHGGNLTELRHVRAGNSYTRQMRIDPQSNRGVRWTPGDGEPDFDTLFDRHGNQQAAYSGRPLSWNARDEVQQVILVARESQINDLEHYTYSQGARVFKRHEYLAANTEHFHQVRYLPDLEIRTKDNGEELHVISVGSARCLHWVANKPEGIDADQLRYSLEDHLGSCVMELDQQAQLISQEGYYPFGETAWMAAQSALEVSYRFVRYSGKEMDVSGLYYYGARYYAPWLQRWVSADPAGDVDGLNLYAMVSNNPLLYVDTSGQWKSLADSLRGLVGIAKKTSDSISQLHELATKFDGLIPEDASINDTRANLTFGKFLKSGYALRSAYKGARFAGGVGATVGSFVGGLVGMAGGPAGAASGAAVGGLIGGIAGAVIGAIAIPIMRYHFLKKGLKLTEVLHTEELKNGAQAVSDAAQSGADLAQSVVDGVTDLVDDSTRLLNGIKRFTENLSSYSQPLQDMFYDQFKPLVGEQQREILKLARSGIDPFEAIEQVLKAGEQMFEEPSEADGVTGRIQQLQRSITEEPSRKPVPKPRLDLQRRRQAEQSSA